MSREHLVSNLLRSNLTVASGTALSRVTGLLRIMVFGWILGQTALSDAYLIANETPNIVYDLLLGGVLSATLVPLFSSFIETEDDEATNVVITISATLMVALTVVAVFAAPLIFRIYTLNPAADVDPDLLRRVGTLLARIFLIQILFYGLTGLANAFLNSRRKFFAAAWSPVASNLVIIATLLTLRDQAWELGDVITNGRLRWTLGLGATGGIAAMAIIVVVAAGRSGFRFRPIWNWKHPVVRKLLTLSAWTLGFVVANQVALVFIRNLAEPGSSDATAYFTAFTFFVLPHGLLAVSISTTFQPEMSRAVARKDKDVVHRTDLARHPLDQPVHAAGRIRDLRVAAADRGCTARVPQLQHGGGRQHGRCAGRLLTRPGRLLGLHVRAARVLRPPRHAHPVHRQRRRERPQHRAGVRAGRPVRRAGTGSGIRDRLSRVGCVGVEHPLQQGARILAAPDRSQFRQDAPGCGW